MIIDHSPTPLESLNPLDATTFGIEINEFTFDLLIKKLYSNPIKSIIRELVSNAWDSHTAAGRTDTPVTVNTPTLFDPYFTVQDYGTGLSHEDMTTLYSTICRSDRRDSNNFLGGFGLGSKSPYSYTDQFTVESRYNGWKRLYAVYKNTNNIPTLSLMDTAVTVERNGLTVKIPVRQIDHYKFGSAIEEQLLFFPQIDTNVPIKKPVVLWESADGTVTLTKTTPHFNGNLYAVVGNVIYQVSHDIFPEDMNKTYGWKGNLFIRCEIGQLSIVPNREDLQYNDATTAYLRAAILDAQAQLQAHVQATIPQCATFNDACKQLGPLRVVLNSFGWWSNSFTHPDRPGEAIGSYITIPLPEGVDAAMLSRGHRRGSSLRIDHWVKKDNLKLDMNTEYELLWCPAKTPYLAERLRQITPNRMSILLRGGNPDELAQHFNNELLIPVITRDLSRYEASTRAQQKRGGTFKTHDGDTIPAANLNPEYDAFVRVNGDYIEHEDNTYSLHHIRIAKQALSQVDVDDYRWVIQIPKSRWTCKLTKELPEALPHMIKHLTELVGVYEEELKAAHTLEQIPNAYGLIRLADAYRYDLRPSPFIKGLQPYKSTPSQIRNLMLAATTFNIPLPKADPEQIKAANTFYTRYQPFIDYNIDLDEHATLLHAYENYLEQLNNV